MKKTWVGLLALGLLAIATRSNAALIVTAVASGDDAHADAGYWSVEFVDGGPTDAIQSITFDLTGTPGAFFDFDGVDNYGGLTGPDIDGLTGLLIGDITVSTSDPVTIPMHPQVLTFTFAPGTFTPGDSFTFGADVDHLGGDPTPGGFVGDFGVGLHVDFEGNKSGSTIFFKVTDTESMATLDPDAIVPEPASLLVWAGLSGLGLGGISLRRRKKLLA